MEKNVIWSAEDVINKCSEYMNAEHVAIVQKACDFATYVHREQFRKSGEPYIVHPIQVAAILAELKMDPETVSAGFLHDVVEDTPVILADIGELFGKDIEVIVDGVTKLSKIRYKSHREQLAENHRKLLLAMSKDLRVIIVKLADRLHNMRTLKHLRPDKQRRIANETLEIYAPLADRLGISTIKWELEDTSLRYLNPQQYYRIVHLMNSRRDERLQYINEAIDEIKGAIVDLKLKDCEIYGRPKHIYSIYRKMRDQHKQFSQIYDLLAIRVIVKSIKDCYAVLGAIHTKWTPMPGRFKDYIAMPKANMYQSLHTTLIGPSGTPFEVQIRTEEMHRVAEYGIAAHWAYKEGKTDGVKETTTGEKLNLFKEIIELQNESSDASDFMESVKGDLFSDRVYVFTPKGDVFELPKGAGPLDMAYSIHTEIGNHTTGAKVNGKIVPLDYQVKNGDIVDILTSQNSAGPSRDWLDLVHTNKARNKVKRFFKQQDRIQNIDRGKDILEEALIEEGYNVHDVLNAKNIERVLAKRHISTSDDMYAALGFGELQPAGIINILTQDIREQKELQRKKQQEKDLLEDHKGIKNNNANSKNKHDESVLIEGIDNLLVRLSHCCNPIPGDEIVGYITKGRGVSVHRTDCPNVKNAEQSGTRLIDVSWNVVSDDRTHYNTDLEIQGYNRSGLLNDVLQAINNTTKQLNSINGRIDHNKMATIDVTVGIRDKVHLQRVIDNIKRVPDVYVVKRTIH
ncbi:bifunctional (p)ppGpp synthetase/guanosine-3',5'-bis(diphosphate) 3'-pyrophosphohydrolase [Ligilactobacillus murinus]|jgi:(p)ppGpp synthetase, RelA/SpoT family|uniref:GTP diphosphokinase n=1 Tax=Ligilactobacillus murinus TaxID=1622 RepID=A0A4Q2AZR2_9LACO|nr:bifunctional (p)ppGpp synthetase/guanosine-3',5'-bis(diphosphate) 3'-pyrophosphohydrolase [Ligilactobacillus murinus]NBH85480.1 bifunctional (p)ppGpp synthetase/guanosine-3',5'-bis(diphosphate) 3'-pyrophosphohydrolase [Lachnospiraceae bacterium]MBF0701079.1 bifunctional (p)ppGpp synthetase/guanosine-3',5'-bis(diphosphate) 3'-pyrophosphohydrolase [Ligilactobacillus murinus]MBF0757292.1 bifunctional (p)ppGpp synthetase/guanosine-3',5'-bis(diphosphate) 3'-pyrophosphohydrolase [Ligilactobacillus 